MTSSLMWYILKGPISCSRTIQTDTTIRIYHAFGKLAGEDLKGKVCLKWLYLTRLFKHASTEEDDFVCSIDMVSSPKTYNARQILVGHYQDKERGSRKSSTIARCVRRSSFSSLLATSLRRSQLGFFGAILAKGS
jgi:hypothetical protein